MPYYDRVTELCLQLCVRLQGPKAFGKAGGMLNKLSGKCWIPKWEKSSDGNSDQGSDFEY